MNLVYWFPHLETGTLQNLKGNKAQIIYGSGW